MSTSSFSCKCQIYAISPDVYVTPSQNGISIFIMSTWKTIWSSQMLRQREAGSQHALSTGLSPRCCRNTCVLTALMASNLQQVDCSILACVEQQTQTLIKLCGS